MSTPADRGPEVQTTPKPPDVETSARETPSVIPMDTVIRAALPESVSGATIDFSPRPAENPPAQERRDAPPEPTDHFSETLNYQGGSPPPEPPGAGPTLGEVGTGDHPRPTVSGYEILGELGRGGMGVVYKARQVGLNRLVALKMVLSGAHAGEQQLARFHTEAEAVAKLDHPNIVQIHDVGELDGLPYFSLEFVPGGSLAESIAGKPRPPREAAAVVQKLAAAMAFAHQHGIIHRDLKSANVLLTLDGTPKITDFGLAKRLESDSGLTKSGTLMGTPSYMSPEQACGSSDAIGPLSDQYSLGAILYELLTGRPPFLAPSVLETIYQVRHQEPVPPRRLQPHVPKDLETICLKCLQKEATKRYEDCTELAEDLRRFLAGESIRARPIGKIERAWRWCRRNPRTASLSAVTGLLACAVALSVTMVVLRLNRERDAVAQTRLAATGRLEEAQAAVSGGDYRRAKDLLGWSDPLLDGSAALADVRERRDTLRDQVDVYAEFKQLLDDARFDCRFGSRAQKERGRQTCARLLALYDQIETRTGSAAAGLPPLTAEQEQLFKEDVFEAFLVASLVEQELATGEESRREAARRAIGWLNRAEQVLPGTRAVYVQRAACWGVLDDREADKADIKRAEAIEPTSAVDRFWRGFAHHLRGDEAARKNDPKAAQEFYRKEVAEYAAFLQLRPDHFWGYFNWAVSLVSLNDLEDAAIGFTTCTRIRPDFPWPYNNRGTIHLRQKRFPLAVQDYTVAIGLNPEYVEAWANRGTAHAALGETEQALRDLDRAVELNPDYAPAYAKRAEILREAKRYPEAARDLDRLIALSTDTGPLYLQRAQVYQAMDRGDDALKDYDRVLAANTRNPTAYFNRAGLHYSRKDYVKARDDYSRVIDIAPKAALAYANRAVVNWLHLKDFDAAIKDWEQVGRLEPANPDPHRFIGAVLTGRRAYREAVESLDRALERKPGYPEVIWIRAQIHLWQGRPKDALKELDAAVAKLTPDRPETLNIRGDVYRLTGDLDRAAADYQRLIEMQPKNEYAHVSLALVCEKQSKPGEAAACFDRLIAADPKVAIGHVRRAEFRRDRGEYDLAAADCDAAAALDPDSALPPLVRASVAAARGNHVEAVRQAEAALKKAPHDGRALYAATHVWSLAGKAAEATDSKLSQQYADRAAALLAAALDKGFHDLTFPEHNRMTTDPALAPVRLHPRVRELLSGRP